MKQTLWFDRKFPTISNIGVLPSILVRLESSPVFLKQKLWPVDENLCEQITKDRWSVKEELGHLIDLEVLWSGRFDDLVHGKGELREADLTNKKTNEANHNKTLLSDLLERFSTDRSELLAKIHQLDDSQKRHSALHPRLKKSMNSVGLAYFIAEHDDHHIASILAKVNFLQQ